jgi:hypothetical protein
MMDQDSSRIEAIIRVAGNVWPPINDERAFAKDSRKSLCQNRSGKSRSYDQQIDRAFHAD